MTNRDMVTQRAAVEADGRAPRGPTSVPVPSVEDAKSPTVEREPIDSPQLNNGGRSPPRPGQTGLSTKR